MSVKFRITLITALFLAFASVTLSGYILRTQRAYLYAESVRKVELTLSMLSDMTTRPLFQGDLLTLARIADRAAAGQPQRVIIADRRGVVIADSAHKLYDRKIAATQAIKQSSRKKVVRKDSIWEGTAPVKDDLGRMIGMIYVTFPTQPMDEVLAHITQTVIAFAVISILLGALVAYGLGHYLSASLVPLLLGIRKAATGKFDKRIPHTGMVELDEIGQAFDWMSRLVGRQVQTLATLNNLATSLIAATTLEEFNSILSDACSTIIDGREYLLVNDPHAGYLTVIGEEKPVRRVAHNDAAFLAANERRAITIGQTAELQPGYRVAEGIELESGIVAPLVTPNLETVGVLVIELSPDKSPSSIRQDEATVLAVANLIAPILATSIRAWTQDKVLGALREILLPEAVPQPEGLEVFACFEPAEVSSGLSGDYYDVIPLGEHRWGLAIGDVTGHGLDAGRYTAMTKYVVRSFAQEYQSPAKIILQADKTLATQMSELKFVTVFFAIMDVQEKELTYCCAGHPPGLLYSPTSDTIRRLQAGGGLLGYGLNNEFEEESIKLQTSDLLLLCTDGILEVKRGDEEYGMKRLEAVIRANAQRSLKNIAKAVIDDVHNFAENMVRDDMTLLLMRVVEQPAE